MRNRIWEATTIYPAGLAGQASLKAWKSCAGVGRSGASKTRDPLGKPACSLTPRTVLVGGPPFPPHRLRGIVS